MIQRTGNKTAMFLRMLLRAALVRPGRAASALLAVIVAATVATAMMTIYVDVQASRSLSLEPTSSACES